LPNRRGYFDRLVADAGRANRRDAVQPPRQILWGPTRPAPVDGEQSLPGPATPVPNTPVETVPAPLPAVLPEMPSPPTVHPTTASPPDPPPSPVTSAAMPAAARGAWERLSLLSTPPPAAPAGPPAMKHQAALPFPAASPMTAQNPRQPERAATVPAPQRPVSQQTTSQAHVHIGTIEVLAAPAPPPAAPPARLPSAARRLSTPPVAYGFGQG
jgi:hypothetical protein